MKSEKIDFPTPLLNALRDGKLVIFAGAGVSMDKPACLPDFKSLAETIAKGTGESLQDGQPIDGFLGRLQDNGVKVHARAERRTFKGRPEGRRNYIGIFYASILMPVRFGSLPPISICYSSRRRMH